MILINEENLASINWCFLFFLHDSLILQAFYDYFILVKFFLYYKISKYYAKVKPFYESIIINFNSFKFEFYDIQLGFQLIYDSPKYLITII